MIIIIIIIEIRIKMKNPHQNNKYQLPCYFQIEYELLLQLSFVLLYF
jgi:hypothetical protein